MTAWPKIL